MSVTRCEVKVKAVKDPKEELAIALSKLKRKIKNHQVFAEYLSHQYYRRPAVRIKEKRAKSLARLKAEQRRNRQQSQN